MIEESLAFDEAALEGARWGRGRDGVDGGVCEEGVIGELFFDLPGADAKGVFLGFEKPFEGFFVFAAAEFEMPHEVAEVIVVAGGEAGFADSGHDFF